MRGIQEFMNLLPVEGDLGVEVEVEGSRLPARVKDWRTEQDGSLRGESVEYVLSRPLSIEGVGSALVNLATAYEKNQSVVSESFRAGVHVHVNCQKLTLTQLFNFICLYLIFEVVFTKWCGRSREGNLFCLSSSDADFMLNHVRLGLIDCVRDGSVRSLQQVFIDGDVIRYSSINLGALGKYGSLEFRGMRSTPDVGLIYKWVEVLYNLRETALQYDSPQVLLQEASIKGVDRFVMDVLGDNFEMFKEADRNYRIDIVEGIRNSQEIAFCVDWLTLENIFQKANAFKFKEADATNKLLEPVVARVNPRGAVGPGGLAAQQRAQQVRRIQQAWVRFEDQARIDNA